MAGIKKNGEKRLTLDGVMKFFPLKKARDIQVVAIEKCIESYNNGAQYVALEAPVGCHAPGTLILLANGSRLPVEDLEVDDEVMGWNSTPQRITELKRGRSAMVRITPVKGEPFDVNIDHILTLVRTPMAKRSAKPRKDCKDGEVIDVTVREWLGWANNRKSMYKLFRQGVERLGRAASPTALPIDPYVLGLFLGDGSLTAGCIVCKNDPELESPLRAEAERFGLSLQKSPQAYRLSLPRGGGRPNLLYTELRNLQLTVTSEQKFIPPQYLTSTKANRAAILAGLLDTDGHWYGGGYDFISASIELADGVTFLARSLGLAAYMSKVQKGCQNGFVGTYWRVGVSGDCTLLPLRITRKKPKARQQKKDVLRTSFTVTPLGEGEFYGFSLDGDGRFLLGDFTVTHNTGKSSVSIALARAMGDQSYMLTLTEQLQDQYTDEFGVKATQGSDLGLRALKGRGKFKCINMSGSATCNDGKHLYKGKSACVGCPYKVAKQTAIEAPHLVANYHSFLWNVTMNASEENEEALGQRPLLVADECHSLEGFLLDSMGITVKLGKLSVSVAPPPDDLDTAEPYFDYIKTELLPKMKEVEKTLHDPRAKEEHAQFVRKLNMVLNSKDEVQWVPERSMLPPFFTVPDKSSFSLKPLTVAKWGPDIWGKGDRQLFMSGTILSALQFVTSIGLDPNVGDHIELDSPFPAENRPIYIGNLDMTKKARGESWPLMTKTVDQLMTSHANDKGLLLCPSNEMLKHIQKGLSRVNNGRLIFATGEDRAAQYQRHLASKTPTVLAASGYWEGANLAEDASRFQIIPQAPRPMFQGQVAARAQKPGGDDWYRWLTWQKFLQGTGRSVRSETDTAKTYVFDRELRKELKRRDTMIPKWVRDACHLVGEKPKTVTVEPAEVEAEPAAPAAPAKKTKSKKARE